MGQQMRVWLCSVSKCPSLSGTRCFTGAEEGLGQERGGWGAVVKEGGGGGGLKRIGFRGPTQEKGHSARGLSK